MSWQSAWRGGAFAHRGRPARPHMLCRLPTAWRVHSARCGRSGRSPSPWHPGEVPVSIPSSNVERRTSDGTTVGSRVTDLVGPLARGRLRDRHAVCICQLRPGRRMARAGSVTGATDGKGWNGKGWSGMDRCWGGCAALMPIASCRGRLSGVGSRTYLGTRNWNSEAVRCGSTTHTLTSGRGRGRERPTHIIMYLLYTSRLGSEGWGVGMGVGFITYVLHAHTCVCVLTHPLMTSHTTRNRLGSASD